MNPKPRPFSLSRTLGAASLALIFVCCLGAAPEEEQGLGDLFGAPANTVSVTTAWSQDGARPGDDLVLGLVLEIQSGYHINANPAQIVVVGDFEPHPTTVTILEASDNLTLETVRFPETHPVTVEYADGAIQCFDGRTVFFVPMRVDETAVGERISVTAQVEYQACDDKQCLFPTTAEVTAVLPLVAADVPVNAIAEELFAEMAAADGGSGNVGFDLFGWKFNVDTSSGLGLAALLLVAMVGGALLNFTPCVLPVIPIKIMSLSNVAGSRSRCFTLGAAMSLGVVFFWLGLGVLIALVSGFTATNQLFQYPAFTIGVGVVIAVMAVGMCGLFLVQLPQWVYRLDPGQESVPGSFGFGIMTAILSTPCTAPFMGAAAAWAATQHPATTLTTFAAIGTGMAFPYFVLSSFPEMVKKMPRTGPGSELIKQVMGLLMLAAAAYFVGVGVSALLNRAPDPPSKMYWWVVMAFSAAAGGWLAFKTWTITPAAGKRLLFMGLGLVTLVGSVWGGLRLTDKGPIDWVYYTPERFEEVTGEGKVVVMDFTAEWCLNCKTLEHGVLHQGRVVDLLSRPEVVAMKVDITGNNPMGKAKLKEAGRLTIPLLVIYAPGGVEVFKSDFYTADQVVKAIRGAGTLTEYTPGS